MSDEIEISPELLSVDAGLSPQHQMLLEQKYQTLAFIDNANDKLDEKAGVLIQAGGLIVALLSAFGLPDIFEGTVTTFGVVAFVITLVAFGAMVALAFVAWLPQKHPYPGTLDWELMWDDIVYSDLEVSFVQVLEDCLKSMTDLQEIGHRKGKLLKWSALMLIIQIVSLMLAAVFG